jgi:hypothetical protein
MIAGGGFREGTLIGETPSDLPKQSGDMQMSASSKIPGPADPIQVPELYATIMASMGIDARKEIMTPIGRPIRFADATPLARLLKDDVAAQVIKT